MSIPKKIHWCWLSGDPVPHKLQKCINSWQKIMPEYEIICWDTKRFDVHRVPFVKQAYDCRKWAFAADYIRLYALYTEGGIYLDSDVKVFERFDKFLHHSAFSSIEYNHTMFKGRSDKNWYSMYAGYAIQGAIIGSEKGNSWIGKCLEYYSDKQFHFANGRFNDDLTIICNVIAKIAYDDYGFRYDVFTDEPQLLREDIVIYPSYMFASLWDDVRPSTVALHLCESGWQDNVTAKSKANAFIRKKMELFASTRIGGYLLYQWKKKKKKGK